MWKFTVASEVSHHRYTQGGHWCVCVCVETPPMACLVHQLTSSCVMKELLQTVLFDIIDLDLINAKWRKGIVLVALFNFLKKLLFHMNTKLMYVCMYVSICVCMYVCMYVCM